MERDLLIEERRDGVALIAYNRPGKHNALSDALSTQWRAAVREAVDDSEVRCIVLAGEGPSFCSGRDTSELGQRSEGESHFDYIRRAQRGRLELVEASKPVVAAVQGYVLGGGCETALAADLRVAATDARFALPEIGFGLVTDTGASRLLTRLVGPARAKYMIMSGERVDAQTAAQWGLVDWLVEPDELRETAMDLAGRLASKSPLALALAKQLVDHVDLADFRQTLDEELVAQTALFTSEDYQEARAARREGREPKFRGR